MGEPDYDLSDQESITPDDLVEVLVARLGGQADDRPLNIAVISIDAAGAFNMTLANGQGFRVTVENDDMERTGT